MISLWRIFSLEFISIMRSKALALLAAASALWMLLLPLLIRDDGTGEGARQIYLRYSFGGVFALLVISLTAVATASIAHEIRMKRLQLTLVRPVRFFAVAWGKTLAAIAAGAIVIVIAAVIAGFMVDGSAGCNHVLSPILPSPESEAEDMYKVYMEDPETPEAVKKAKKPAVLRLLVQRARDHYQTVTGGGDVEWIFPAVRAGDASVRLRFSTNFNSRENVIGRFTLGGAAAVITNQTQAVVTVPFDGSIVPDGERMTLGFVNEGENALMLRPRADINILVPADGFVPNILRGCMMMIAALATVIAFGVFLSSALSRPVALFTAIVILVVGEISPGVVDQYPDQLDAPLGDRFGLFISRTAISITAPFASIDVFERFASDECIEWREMFKSMALDLALIPLMLSVISGFILRRRDLP